MDHKPFVFVFAMDMKKSSFILLFFFISFGTLAQKIAIMGALEAEVNLLKDNLKGIRTKSFDGVTFYKGKLAGKKVVLLQAGVGKVNAAYGTAILLSHFKIKSVLFTGVAGGIHPETYPGDIVIGKKMIQYDFGKLDSTGFSIWPTRNALAPDGKNPLYIPCDSVLFHLAVNTAGDTEFENVGDRNPEVFTGNIATGDMFINQTVKAKWLYQTFDAYATEMEGAAVAQVCYMQNVPFLIIRSCSDNANNQAHLDFSAFLKPAANNSAKLVMAIMGKL